MQSFLELPIDGSHRRKQAVKALLDAKHDANSIVGQFLSQAGSLEEFDSRVALVRPRLAEIARERLDEFFGEDSESTLIQELREAYGLDQKDAAGVNELEHGEHQWRKDLIDPDEDRGTVIHPTDKNKPQTD